MEEKKPSCQVCGGIGSLKHILSSCQTALMDGHYRWRHDQILKEIVEVVNTEISANTWNPEKDLIRFVRAGVKSKPKEKNTPNALSLATDRLTKGWFREKIKIPRPYSPNIITPIYTDIFEQNKENINMGIDSSKGGTRSRGSWTKEVQIW